MSKSPLQNDTMKTSASRSKPSRKLRSMRVSDSYRDFVIDQLSDVRGLRTKAMFGGIGLYADDVFFGIVASDVLYFKVDDSNRADYEAAGSKPFKPFADGSMTMTYWSVPVDVLEAAPTLAKWAGKSIRVASALGVSKKSGTRRKTTS